MRRVLPLLLLIGCAHEPSVSPASSQQHAVDAAGRNVADARVAVADAQQLDRTANLELESATRAASTQESAVAQRELFAARAKKDYADRLIDLRRAELVESRAELDLVVAGYSQVAREHAQSQLAIERARVADLRGNVESLRTVWTERARDYQTASRGHVIPQAPFDDLPSTREVGGETGAPPGGGANEGPSAPQSIPQD
jgi:hypothetical protein